MRLYVDHIRRVRGVAEYSLALPRFVFIAVLVIHMKTSETNPVGVFSVHLFRERLEEGLLSLATGATLTG